jgi:hypothetical protein
MIVDRGPQILQLAATGAIVVAMLGIFAAKIAVDVGQRLVAEKIDQLIEARGCLFWSRLALGFVASVERDYVGDRDGSRRTDAGFDTGDVFGGDIGSEGCRSAAIVLFATSRAFSMIAVLDDPDGGMGEPAGAVMLGFT